MVLLFDQIISILDTLSYLFEYYVKPWEFPTTDQSEITKKYSRNLLADRSAKWVTIGLSVEAFEVSTATLDVLVNRSKMSTKKLMLYQVKHHLLLVEALLHDRVTVAA